MVKKLTDQAVLARVALEGKSYQARLSAVYKLTDRAVLAKVAMDDENGYVQRQAQSRLDELRKGNE